MEMSMLFRTSLSLSNNKPDSIFPCPQKR